MKELFENWREFREKVLNEQFTDIDLAGKDERPLRDSDLAGMGRNLYLGFFRRLAYSKDQALHVRAFAKYLAHDTADITEDFLTEGEKRFLIRFILLANAWQGRSDSYHRRKRSKIKGSGWDQTSLDFSPPEGPLGARGPLGSNRKIIIGYPDYNRVARDQPGHQYQSLTGGSLYESFEKFLGQFTATWDGEDTIEIFDIYDFSSLSKNKVIFKNLSDQMAAAVKRAAIPEFAKGLDKAEKLLIPVAGPALSIGKAGKAAAYRFIRSIAPHPDVGTPYKVKLTLTGVQDVLPTAKRSYKHQTRKRIK